MRYIVFALCLFCSIAVAEAAPTLGTDCGTGASIVGSNDAGRVVIGTHGPTESPYSCTVFFTGPHPNIIACSAMNQTAFNSTADGSRPSATGAVVATNGASVVLGTESSYAEPIVDGDTVTYICR
jgi:hypothetical protein